MKNRNQRLVKQVILRDLGLCRCCGFKANEVHHIIPLYLGGEDILSNMVALCHECHTGAPDTKEEFFEYMRNGGKKLTLYYGVLVKASESINMPIHELLPIGKKLLVTLRNIDYTNAIETYNLKESLLIEDIS